MVPPFHRLDPVDSAGCTADSGNLPGERLRTRDCKRQRARSRETADRVDGCDALGMSDEIEIDARRAQELVDGGAQLVDVREDYEVEAGRIPGSRHVNMSRLSEAAETIDRETPVVFYCRVGGRSAVAAQAFRGAGYEAYSMQGGILGWHDGGGALEPEDGTVADH
jgi:rhodanese-related sulfurtransferase